MKHFFLIAIAFTLITVYACKDDGPDSVFEYHAHIHNPSNADRVVGDTLPIEVEFESHTGMTIHHINVRIFNKSTLTEVYSQPAEAHVHDTSGAYTFEDVFILSAANGRAYFPCASSRRSWPQAALMSVPRRRRTVALTPSASSSFWKRCTLASSVAE